MKNEKDKKEELQDSVTLKLTDEIEKERYEESEEILDILENYPGSRRDELNMMSGFCPTCFNRRMAWLEINELVEFDGEYYWLAKED